ncbi:hypothetical protein CDEST_09055 [Colletotrichum destructivum]|uniref:Uncharacterized protein n=1 Tax=Colletotrichum destructivum TaxID=34406 RepID=A0AAX4IMA6_9PEZI|nr:hypothetical protein CDEST_09055 [Colletotrichum destructivum]
MIRPGVRTFVVTKQERAHYHRGFPPPLPPRTLPAAPVSTVVAARVPPPSRWKSLDLVPRLQARMPKAGWVRPEQADHPSPAAAAKETVGTGIRYLLPGMPVKRMSSSLAVTRGLGGMTTEGYAHHMRMTAPTQPASAC